MVERKVKLTRQERKQARVDRWEERWDNLLCRWDDYRDGDLRLRHVFFGEPKANDAVPAISGSNNVEDILARDGWDTRSLENRSRKAKAEAEAAVRERRMMESPILAMLSVELAAKKTDFDLLAYAVAQHDKGDINSQQVGRFKVERRKFSRRPQYPRENNPQEEFDMTYDVEDLGKKIKRAVPVKYEQGFDYEWAWGQSMRSSANFIVNFTEGEINSVQLSTFGNRKYQGTSYTSNFLQGFVHKSKSYGRFLLQWTDLKTDPKLTVGNNAYIYNPTYERFEIEKPGFLGTEPQFIEPTTYTAMLLEALDRVPQSLEIV